MNNVYITPQLKKKLSRYKLKKQSSIIEKILDDPQILAV